MVDRQIIISNDALDATISPPFPFLQKLPREIRDKIYWMLLTTSYNYTETIQGGLTELESQQILAKTNRPIATARFNLNPAILQANKQISKETAEILYTANEFIFVSLYIADPERILEHLDSYENSGLGRSADPWKALERVPAFRRLSRARVINPVLRVTIDMIEKNQLLEEKWVTLITIPEAMPLLLEALWIYGTKCHYYKNYLLALKFRSRNPS